MRMPLLIVAALIVLMAGCGGSGDQAAQGPVPPGDIGPGETLEIGPLVVRTEKTSGFKAENIFSARDCAFVALYGAQINYLASTALLDRVVFASNRNGYYNIFVSNLDGSGVVRLTNNGAEERWPRWSPDGSKIVFQRQWPSNNPVICTMNADGTGVAALTSNVAASIFPEWSPEGGRITYSGFTGGTFDVFTMYADGSAQTNITSNAAIDMYSAWSPDGRTLVFGTLRYGGGLEIATSDAYGGVVTRLTNDTYTDFAPSWHPWLSRLTYTSARSGFNEIFTMRSSDGGDQRNFSASPANDEVSCYSADGTMIAFGSDRAGNYDVWIRETNFPDRTWQVTTHSAEDREPDLGSPTVQTDRVLIGPAGADRGGKDPVFSSAPAVIAAFSLGGYRNLVRIGVATEHLGSMQIKPFSNTGRLLSGVEVSATKVANVRQDAGWGKPPTVWDFNVLSPGMVLLYFDIATGKLASVVPVKDSVYSSGAGDAQPAAYVASVDGEALVLSGDFPGVFDAEGRNLAPNGASSVRLGSDGQVLGVN